MLQSLDTLIAFVTIMMICSLFVLIIVQMIAAALSLRGKNFANALGLTFQTLAPTLTENAHKLAQKILSDPLLSDSMLTGKDRSDWKPELRGKQWAFFGMFDGAMRLANAIRPDEVYAALKKLSQGDDKEMKEAADAVLTAFSDDSAHTLAMKSRIKVLAGTADAVLSLPNTQAAKDAILATLHEASGKLINEIDGERERLERWINVAQDRAEQWFRTHTRGVTIAVSIVFAMFCQIDAVEVYKHVSTDASTREALVKAGTKMIEDGDGWMNDKNELPQRVLDAWNQTFKCYKLNPAINDGQIATVRRSAKMLITAEMATQGLEGKKAEDLKKLEANFESEFDAIEQEQLKAYYESQGRKLNELSSITGEAGFQILPPDGWRWPVEKKALWSWANWGAAFRHLPGILLFAGLLTLGAPYWFNLLKNLSSLRPALAQLIEAEKQTAQSSRSK